MQRRRTVTIGLTAMAIPLALLLAPGVAAAKAPDTSPCAEANRSIVGVAMPSPGSMKSGVETFDNEIIATACFTRLGDTQGRVRLTWGAVGHLYEGIFFYELVDCATGEVADARYGTLEYPQGTPDDVNYGSAEVVFPLDPGHTYQPRVLGNGIYDRASLFGQQVGAGLSGHFGQFDNPENRFSGDGGCA